MRSPVWERTSTWLRRRASGNCQKFPVAAYAALTLVAVGMNGGCSELSTRPTSSPPAPQAKSTVEFHPGYPPAWVKNYKHLPPEVIPGAKLGYSKDESAKRVRPEVRELLDLLRRIYYEPALLARPKEVLNLLHVNSVKRDEFRTTMSDGSIDQSFKEYFRAGGLFDGGYWRGYYVYQGFDNDIPRERWGARLEVELDRKLECIDSRAVEGYIDLPIDPGLWPPLNPVPRERWDRHGVGTGSGLIARSPASSTAGVTMWFADGCLAAIGAGARFENKKVSNEEVFKR